LQYFGNASCHYQAKIISKEETDNIIIRYIKGLLPKQNRTQRPYLVGDFPKKNISGGPNKKNSY